MITSVNKDNVSQYKKLYAEINSALGLSGDDEVNSIEGVFDNLATLRQATKTVDGKEVPDISKVRLTRLPLACDEDYFNIDLDTRTITVPSAFSKNGISVKGDVIAETVYFKSERYFDNMDLSDEDVHVFIQYTNANSVEKIVETTMKDCESEPGYIVIEWPISEVAAEASGSLKFAVRFCKYDENDKLIYSLSTLSQTVKINDTLDFSDFKNDIFNASKIDSGLTETMKSRLIKTNNNLPVIGKATDPEFIIGLTAGQQDITPQDETGKLTLTVSAIPDGDGVITYYLYKNDTKVDDAVFTATTVGTGDDAQEAFSVDIADDDCIGKYYISATNRVKLTITDEVYTPALEDGAHTYVEIPAPTQVEEPVIAERAYTDSETEKTLLSSITQSPDTNGVLSYQWLKYDSLSETYLPQADAVLMTYVPTADGSYKLQITNYLNKETTTAESNVCRVTALPSTPVIKYSDKLVADVIEPTENAIVEELSTTTGFTITATIDDASRIDEDKLEYQWYQYKKGRFSNDDDIAESKLEAIAGTYIDPKEDGTKNFNDIIQTGATTATFPKASIQSGEYYYCVVTNTYNGKVVSVTSPFFKAE